ncbi:SGNH/GDSL hydrolase family protein [Aestuariibacter salexigens]|uniref:SGNH/GDSL hydrolase family protein n=1 Tax=Aestuariibacter salexigens TaxID=226010 RepID=UPI00040FA807|nr:SGNH/GDSL hydrolase family protein [Aestuariibacter salexigens]
MRLLIVGDSSAAGVGAESQQQALAFLLAEHLGRKFHIDWVLHARSGANTRDALAMIEEVPAQPFDIVITVLGVNDVTSRIGKRHWLIQQQRLHQLISGRFHAPKIVVCGLPPIGEFPALPQPLRWYLGQRAHIFERSLKASVAQHSHAEFFALDFSNDVTHMASDGFHPGPKAYQSWAQKLAMRIERLLTDAVSG